MNNFAVCKIIFMISFGKINYVLIHSLTDIANVHTLPINHNVEPDLNLCSVYF